MARPREFDEEAVVFHALTLFWRLGYEGCSLQELLEVTGLSRQSLYNAYGSKHGLFVAVLDRYLARVREDLSPLRCEGASLDDLADYMHGALASQEELGNGACLLVSTAFTPMADDARIQATVAEGARAVRHAFAELVRKRVACGELPETTRAKDAAHFLFSVLNGSSALLRTGGSKAQVRRVVSHAVESLRAP